MAHRRDRIEESTQPTIETGIFTFDVSYPANSLDSFRKDLAENTGVYTVGVAAATGALTILTAGYTAWTLRGGYLLSSLLSSLPAWRMMDPLPVLNSFQPLDDQRKRGDDRSDESLQEMIKRANSNSIPPDGKTSEANGA